MVNDLLLTKFSPQNASTKQKTIVLLGDKWPLTIKEVHAALRKEYYSEISYQAAHKLVVSLEDENVLTRRGNTYCLNRDWIAIMKQYFIDLDEKYSETSGKYELSKSSNQTVWKFTDYSLMAVNLAKLFMSKKLVGKEDSVGLGLIRHGIFPIDFNFYDFELMAKMLRYNKGGYAVIEKNSPFDKWIAKQYVKGGFIKVKTGVSDLHLTNDILIHGGYVLEISYSPETIQIIDNIFEKIANIQDLYLNFLTKKINQKLNIKVQITKNPEMATFIKNQIIKKYF